MLQFLRFQVLLDNVQAKLPETIPFFICLNGCAEQVFFKCLHILLGIYNFGNMVAVDC